MENKLPSGKVKDLKGKTFGEWTVLGFSHLDDYSCSVWECKCSCGTIRYLKIGWLKSKNIGSCGCKKSEKIANHHRQDLTNIRFNRLVGLRAVGKNKNNGTIWEWVCDCGNIIKANAGDVKSGNTKSCGCLKSESTIKYNILYKRKPNNHANKTILFGHYRNHAKNRKLVFEITKEEFVEMAEANCYYCGDSPVRTFRGNSNSGEWNAEGVDRLDSSKGYTKENTVPCCKQCNTMKMDYTEEQFYEKIVKIYNNRKLGDKFGNLIINNQPIV